MHIPLKGSPAPHIPEPLSWRIVCSPGLQVFLADKWLLLQDEALLVWLLLCQIVMAHYLYIYWAFKSEYTEAFKKRVSQK